MTVIDVATNIYHEQFPYVDHGLRRAVIVQIDARMPAIIGDEGAWKELMEDRKVLKALHVHMCEGREDSGGSGVVTPPATPVALGKGGRRKWGASSK
jgi:histone acetyltransferase HTATIP